MIPRKKPDKKVQRKAAQLTGPVRYTPPKGKDEDRPLNKLRREYEAKRIRH